LYKTEVSAFFANLLSKFGSHSNTNHFFPALHALHATRSSTKKLSVRPSAPPSAKRVDCDKTTETCAHILILRERSFILVFWQEEWLVGRAPPST